LKEDGYMKITAIRWHPYRIPLRKGFTTAHGTLTERTGAIVEVISAEAIRGFGEIAPLPEFGSVNMDGALAPLPKLAARLQGKDLAGALDLLYAEAEAGSLPASTVFGLEVALLDALGKIEGYGLMRASARAAPPLSMRSGVYVNAVVGGGTTADAVRDARSAVADGFRCVKLKMGQGVQEEIERVAAVRAVIGPNTHLRLDANEGWSFEQACMILTGCAQDDIQYVEQPLPASDLAGMCALRRCVSVPIAADEAISDLASARRILAQGAADVLIIKPQLAGGLRAGQRIIEEAATHGVQCVVTSALETGIGVVAVLHLAAAIPAVKLECGLATLRLLEDDLLLDDLSIRDGFLALLPGPGLGVQLDRAALSRYTWTP
jgi:o-succinylbenzoate synthase